uniref:Uncharacterized protein n=1 Tax=Gopherus agassizii TaxID=38772 RepID=A0A452IAK3_9SAUR
MLAQFTDDCTRLGKMLKGAEAQAEFFHSMEKESFLLFTLISAQITQTPDMKAMAKSFQSSWLCYLPKKNALRNRFTATEMLMRFYAGEITNRCRLIGYKV